MRQQEQGDMRCVQLNAIPHIHCTRCLRAAVVNSQAMSQAARCLLLAFLCGCSVSLARSSAAPGPSLPFLLPAPPFSASFICKGTAVKGCTRLPP